MSSRGGLACSCARRAMSTRWPPGLCRRWSGANPRTPLTWPCTTTSIEPSCSWRPCTLPPSTAQRALQPRINVGAGRRVTVLTGGHLSTCPRMLKVADSLADVGYAVRVVATVQESWAARTDDEVRAHRSWPLTLIDSRRRENPATYWTSGIRYRASRAVAAGIGAARVPLAIAARASGRLHPELVHAALSEPA